MADRIDDVNDDNVQHGIDDDPHDDGKKGLELGALGGGTVGAIAGLAAGPIGAIVGAIVGGTAGSIASGAAVDAVDSVDNDNTVTGIGSGSTGDINESGVTRDRLHTPDMPGNNTPGVQTGGTTTAGADTRGIMEKTADAVTGDNVDDKTGGRVTQGATSGMANNIAAMGAAVMGTSPTDSTTTGTGNMMAGDTPVKVELAEEELHVEKARQQVGEVQVHKEVVQEQVEVPVTLEHEEIVVTRHAVNGGTAGAIGADEEVVRIPVSEEVANVSKTAHVVEEVEIGKRTVTENQTVSGTVRHEELDVDDPTKNKR